MLKVLITFLQEVRQDIVFRHAQLTALRRCEEMLPRIRAHLFSVVNKIRALLEYQGVLHYIDALALLGRLLHSLFHDMIVLYLIIPLTRSNKQNILS
jgi:hypothetical protein